MENILTNKGLNGLNYYPELNLALSQENRITRKTRFPLRLANEWELVEIVSLTGGRSLRERLVSLGLGIGVRLEIIQNHMNGKILLGLDGSRLYLGGGMAHKIQVIIVEGGNK